MVFIEKRKNDDKNIDALDYLNNILCRAAIVIRSSERTSCAE